MPAAPASIPGLLESAPEEGARRLAIRWIDDAIAKGEVLVAGDDEEALHDMRVALRRLRTVLRTYERELGGGVSKKRKKKLKKWVGQTGEGRDAEVQLAWLDEVRGELDGSAQRGAEWLGARLAKRKDAAYADLREHAVPGLARLLPKLRRDLERYRLEHVVFEPRPAHRFADATARLLAAQAAELRDNLRRVRSIEDEALAHEARKDGKRLRYLLEPLRDEGLDAAKDVVKELKGLQDLLGELNDVAVRTALLREEMEHAALSRARRLADEAQAGALERDAATRADEQLGLLALMRISQDRREALFEQLLREWIAEDGALDRLVDDVDELARTLSGSASGPPREIERKYLLRSVPPHARSFPSTEIDQGYVPGKALHERLRRTRTEGEERWFRTIKLGKGLSRIELEEETTREIFSKMWALTKGKRVRKRRFRVEDGEHVWEIDEFLDRALVLAEVELDREDVEVEIPAWLAPHLEREVTDEDAYVNLNLAR